MESTEIDKIVKIAKTDVKVQVIKDRKEILFDGYFYDVTDFVKKHPGGSIIEYYTKTGEDSTHAIQQFHQRSIKRVRAIMGSFKKRLALDCERNFFQNKFVILNISFESIFKKSMRLV